MRNLILHLSRHQNKTIVVSSHLLHEIEQVSTRMLIIDDGKKMVEGTVASLMDPAKTLVEAEVNDRKVQLTSLKTQGGPDGCRKRRTGY